MSKKIPIAKVRASFVYNEGLLLWRTGPRFLESAGNCRLSDGYCRVCLDRVYYLRSRLVWAYHYGDPAHMTVDHKNRDTSDDRVENLRLVTMTEQARNKGLQANNPSGFNGVNWSKRSNKWKATVVVDSKKVHLGFFDSFEDAVAARKAANVRYNFDPTHGE